MLRTLLPLAVLGFAVYLLIDIQLRYRKLQKEDRVAAYEYRRSHALLMTLMVMLVIVILYATYKGFMSDFGDKVTSIRQKFRQNVAFAAPYNAADLPVYGGPQGE